MAGRGKVRWSADEHFALEIRDELVPLALQRLDAVQQLALLLQAARRGHTTDSRTHTSARWQTTEHATQSSSSFAYGHAGVRMREQNGSDKDEHNTPADPMLRSPRNNGCG